jgi:hypothetical protein
MKKRYRLPSQELLKSRLNYNPDTGIFTWIIKPAWGTYIGDIAGGPRRKSHGTYLAIKILDYGQIDSHRLAWIYVHGSIPDGMEIDHKDRNPSNNRLSNLRLATSSEQKRNKGVQSNNRCGLKGAFYHNRHEGKPNYASCKNWRSQIKAPDKKLIFLGYFHTPEDAHEAYKAAAVKYYGEWACLG